MVATSLEIGNSLHVTLRRNDEPGADDVRQNSPMMMLWINKWVKLMSFVVLILFTVSMMLTGAGIADIWLTEHNKDFSSNSEEDGIKLSISPSEAPTSVYESDLTSFLEKNLGKEMKMSAVVNSSQWKARMWMMEKDPVRSKEFFGQEDKGWIVMQRFALLTLYFEFGGSKSHKIDWPTMHECQSQLIICDENGRVLSLQLGK